MASPQDVHGSAKSGARLTDGPEKINKFVDLYHFIGYVLGAFDEGLFPRGSSQTAPRPHRGGLAMLDILRKHASSWAIKAILGLIVVTFVFFFGYNSMRKTQRIGRLGGSGVAMTVNGTPVSMSEYKFLLDSNTERLRASFQGKEMPEFVRKMAESATFQQLLARELSLQQADALGLEVSDEELVDTIRKTPSANRGGEFDPIFYKHEFLPYFKHRFGLDYEAFVLHDLKSEDIEQLFRDIDANLPTPKGAEATDEDAWTFEVISLAPKALVEAKAVKSPEEVSQIATALIGADPKTWKGMLSPFKVEPQKVGPIKIKDRATLLDGQATFDDLSMLFSLTEKAPIVQRPLERGDRLYVVRLVSRTKGSKESVAPWPAGDFFHSWMQKLAEKAKVTSALKEQQ
jgi:hypothetical protein